MRSLSFSERLGLLIYLSLIRALVIWCTSVLQVGVWLLGRLQWECGGMGKLLWKHIFLSFVLSWTKLNWLELSRTIGKLMIWGVFSVLCHFLPCRSTAKKKINGPLISPKSIVSFSCVLHIGAKSQEEAAQRTSRGHGVLSFRPVDLIPSVEAGATASSSSKSSTAAAGDSGQSDGLTAGQAGFQSLLTSSYSSSSPWTPISAPSLWPGWHARMLTRHTWRCSRICGWPRAKRGLCILVLLTGEAQLAAHTLTPECQLDYTALRSAIPEQVGLLLEEHCWYVHIIRGAIFTYAQWLLESCKSWFKMRLWKGAER